MNVYAVSFKGRSTRRADGAQGRETRTIEALDIHDARSLASELAAAGLKLDGVVCDEVNVANVVKVKY